jgi:hypothetical protein
MPDDNSGGGAGLITAGIQAGTAIGRGIGANKRQKRARKWALEDWDRVNAYNHPQAQMQRLQEAKLNPNLIYGKGSSAANTAGTVGQTALNTTAAEEISTGVGAAATSYHDTRLKRAQTAATSATAIKTAADTVNIGVKTDTDKRNLEILKKTGYRMAEAQVNAIEENTSRVVDRGLQERRLDQTQEQREKLQTEIKNIEAKLRRNGLTPNSPDYLKLMVLNKSELNKLLNYFK